MTSSESFIWNKLEEYFYKSGIMLGNAVEMYSNRIIWIQLNFS